LGRTERRKMKVVERETRGERKRKRSEKAAYYFFARKFV
jgi:hypothetical protein